MPHWHSGVLAQWCVSMFSKWHRHWTGRQMGCNMQAAAWGKITNKTNNFYYKNNWEFLKNVTIVAFWWLCGLIGSVVPGAGAFEIAAHAELMKCKDSVKGRSRLGLSAVLLYHIAVAYMWMPFSYPVHCWLYNIFSENICIQEQWHTEVAQLAISTIFCSICKSPCSMSV